MKQGRYLSILATLLRAISNNSRSVSVCHWSDAISLTVFFAICPGQILGASWVGRMLWRRSGRLPFPWWRLWWPHIANGRARDCVVVELATAHSVVVIEPCAF